MHIEADKLEKLVKSVLLAPSGSNQRPWEFVFVMTGAAGDVGNGKGPQFGAFEGRCLGNCAAGNPTEGHLDRGYYHSRYPCAAYCTFHWTWLLLGAYKEQDA